MEWKEKKKEMEWNVYNIGQYLQENHDSVNSYCNITQFSVLIIQ